MDKSSKIRRNRIVLEAEGYLELNMPSHAEICLAKLADAIYSDGYASFLFGEALREQERYEEAIEPFERAIDLLPSDIQQYVALAWCYKRTQQLSLAIDILEQALEVWPEEAILHYNLACYWSLDRNNHASIRCLSMALQIDDDYRQLIATETDFDNVRDDPHFQDLLTVIV